MEQLSGGMEPEPYTQLGDDSRKKPNTLPLWGSPTTMNMNSLILTNIQQSPYFTGPLSELKTYHEVVDEIYYKVTHLEPWEKGSRKIINQTGMCGGVRGVSAGGIISTPFCLLFKLFTLRLTRKQVNGLLNHKDSPYIRALGFMYIRFTQPPADLWEWFETYIEDPEEIEVRAGGSQVMTIGEMVRLFLTKLDWFSSLFPRIPVPIQIGIDRKLTALKHATSLDATPKKVVEEVKKEPEPPQTSSKDIAREERRERDRGRDRVERDRTSDREKDRRRSTSRERRRSRSRSPYRSSRSSHSSRSRHDRNRDRDRDRHRR